MELVNRQQIKIKVSIELENKKALKKGRKSNSTHYFSITKYKYVLKNCFKEE